MFNRLRQLFGWVSSDAGSAAERAAAQWLQRERHFQVLARNWRNPRDRREELDLVCADRDVVVFVEVKARAAGALVPGYFAVDARKKRALVRAAKAYLGRLHPKPVTFRFDIVEVTLPAGGLEIQADAIRHFENVPLFSKHYRG
jgi:putative endonuclease